MMQRLTLDEAIECVRSHSAGEIAGVEWLDLGDAYGRALAQDLYATVSSPSFRSSAMDGFAVRSQDILAATSNEPVQLTVVGEARAGHPWDGALQEGQAVAISTGACVPPGADSVVRVEDTRTLGQTVSIFVAKAAGCDIREIGEDYHQDECLLQAGSLLSPQAVSLLASAGHANLPCVLQPTVAILTTGDELCQPGQPLKQGQIYESNAVALTGLVNAFGAKVEHVAAVGDTYEQTYEAIKGALHHDMILLSGGVSVGQHDCVKDALRKLGVREVFWRVNQRPGGPLWFGVFSQHALTTLVFGLPGNPGALLTLMHIYVRRAIFTKLGLTQPKRIYARLSEPVHKAVGKAHLLRVRLTSKETGSLYAQPAGLQGSHILTSFIHADAIAILPADVDEVPAGAVVEVELL